MSTSGGSGGSGGTSNAIPVANTAGYTINVVTPDPVSGDGTQRVLELAADQSAIAIKLATDPFPSWLFASTAVDGLYMNDGSVDPYTDSNAAGILYESNDHALLLYGIRLNAAFHQIAMGQNAQTDASGQVVIGANSSTVGSTQGVAIGLSTNATADGYPVAIGHGAKSDGTGDGIAIGLDAHATDGAIALGSGVVATGVDNISIGTTGSLIQLSNNGVGPGAALLAANCPATDPTTPYTWIALVAGDGTPVFVPAWA